MNGYKTSYPIDIKLHINKNWKVNFNLFNLNLKDYIPVIEYPLGLESELKFNLLNKDIRTNLEPKLRIGNKQIEIYIEQEELVFTTAGSAFINPQSPKVVKIDADKAIFQVIKKGYEAQKKAIAEAQKALEEAAVDVHDLQKEAIANVQKDLEKGIEKASKEIKKASNNAYKKQKKIIKKIAFWEKW